MKLTSLFVTLFLITPAFFFGQSPSHVPVGSRPMSEQAENEIQSQQGNLTEEEKEADAELQTSSNYIFDQYPKVYFSNAYHWLISVTIDNTQYQLELEDGSIWKINSYDGMKALNWLSNDALTITQNNRWFSTYQYRIINQTNGNWVEANLFLGPIVEGEYSRFITGIDFANREILLNDNSIWRTSYLDETILQDWRLNDYIIIGTNSDKSFWDSGNDTLLINVNVQNSRLRAKQI